ncbi:hypothetical protein MTR67_051901, partial [Solanum verrucosum]
GIGDPPFGQFQHLFALAFSIFKFYNFGRYRIAWQNCSTTRRLLLSIADLIFSFRVWHTGALGETLAIRRLDNGLGDPQAFFSSFFQLPCSFLLISVHALFLNPNTLKSRIYISYWHKNMHLRTLNPLK